MFKKTVKSIILSVLLLLSLLLGVACSSNTGSTNNTPSQGSENSPEIDYKQIGVEVEGGKTLINGFEYIDRDVMLTRMVNRFGRVEQNKNTKFVRTGKYSLKVTPISNYGGSSRPFFMLPLTSLRFEELAFSNMSKVEKVSMWVYNNKAEDTTVGLALGYDFNNSAGANSIELAKRSISQDLVVKNGWNYLEFDIVPDYYDYAVVDIEAVQGLALVFAPNPNKSIAEADELYIDDVCFTYSEQVKTYDFLANVATGTKEDGTSYWMIADFEKFADMHLFDFDIKWSNNTDGFPKVETVYASEYGVTATSGNQSMLITVPNVSTYKTLALSGKFTKQVIDLIGQDVLDNPNNYYLKADICNLNDVDCSVQLRTDVGMQATIVKAHEWLTLSVPFRTILSEQYNTYAEDGITVTSNGIDKLVTRGLMFLMPTFNQTGEFERLMMLDNIRIEKVNTTVQG